VADAGDEREAWLARDAAGHVSLLGRWSPTSGRHHFPPAALCPCPGADDVELVPQRHRGLGRGHCRRHRGIHYHRHLRPARRRAVVLRVRPRPQARPHQPQHQIDRRQAKGFAGHTLGAAANRRLLRRWTDTRIDAIERTVGLLCLLHAARPAELRALTIGDTDLVAGCVRLGRRPHPVPLDPLTHDALNDCLATRRG
jgi:integrase